MGQSSSSEANPVQEEARPRIVVARELEEKIVQDFQNEQLQQAWNKVQMSMLDRRGQRTLAQQQAEAQIQANQQAAQVAQARSAQLTQAMERFKAQFADEAVALEYDIKNLLQKQPSGVLALVHTNNSDSSPSANSTVATDGDDDGKEPALPCLGPRAHWIDCQKKYALDSRPCDSHLLALEKCIRQSILKE